MLITVDSVDFNCCSTRSYSIHSHTLCKGIDESKSPDAPIDPTHTFYDTDQQVCSLVVLENMDRSYDICTKWFTPDGDLFKKFDEVTEDPRAEGYPYWEYYSTNSKLFLQGEDADAKRSPGQWRVEFCVNDELPFTDSFELKSTQSYSIRSYTTCKGIDDSEYPYKPIDPTTVFYDTDEEFYCLTILENVTSQDSLLSCTAHGTAIFTQNCLPHGSLTYIIWT